MSTTADPLAHKWRNVGLLAFCEALALALWFSATAVVPVLKQTYALPGWQASLFSSAVAMGFVAGTLTSAILGLADRLDPGVSSWPRPWSPRRQTPLCWRWSRPPSSSSRLDSSPAPAWRVSIRSA